MPIDSKTVREATNCAQDIQAFHTAIEALGDDGQEETVALTFAAALAPDMWDVHVDHSSGWYSITLDCQSDDRRMLITEALETWFEECPQYAPKPKPRKASRKSVEKPEA